MRASRSCAMRRRPRWVVHSCSIVAMVASPMGMAGCHPAGALEDPCLGRGDVAVARLRQRREDAVLQAAVGEVEQ
ncbi:MAG: hypothetical protein ACRDS0_18535 [Pseudonocardiaceae bacterium]